MYIADWLAFINIIYKYKIKYDTFTNRNMNMLSLYNFIVLRQIWYICNIFLLILLGPSKSVSNYGGGLWRNYFGNIKLYKIIAYYIYSSLCLIFFTFLIHVIFACLTGKYFFFCCWAMIPCLGFTPNLNAMTQILLYKSMIEWLFDISISSQHFDKYISDDLSNLVWKV